jgi:hypothetical protein
MKKIVTRHSLAVAALVLAVIVPVTLYVAARQSKSLSFTVVARSPLVDVSQPQLANLEVSYRGEKIQKVESLTLLFENSGNVSIGPRDFENPMEVILGKDCRVLSAELANTSPPSIKPKVSHSDTGIAIAPLLLNANDRFALTIVVAGNVGIPLLDARVAGISEIATVDRQAPKLKLTVLFICILFLIGSCLGQYLGGLNWSLATLPLILPSADLRVGSMLVAILNGAYFGFFLTNTDLPYVQLLIIAVGITLLSIPFFSFAKKRVATLYSADTTTDT